MSAKAVLCPVCQGAGNVVVEGWQDGSTGAVAITRGCHGCGGRGWVEVREDDDAWWQQSPVDVDGAHETITDPALGVEL